MGQSLARSFTYVSVTEVNKSVHTEQNFMELYSDITAVALPTLLFAQIVPVKEHISCVLFQTQSIWLGCRGRVPSLKLGNSKSPVFSTVACSLEELQGRMLMGLLLQFCKTLSAEWIQTQTTQICQFLGKASFRFDSVDGRQ